MDAATGSSSSGSGDGNVQRRPPRPRPLQMPLTTPLEVGGSGASDGSSGRRLVGRSIETLAGEAGMMLHAELSTPIHAKLQASLGSEFGVLPSSGASALLPDEEEEDMDAAAGGASSGSNSAASTPASRAGTDAGAGGRGQEQQGLEGQEEELSPLHELRDVEAALGGDGPPPPEEDSGGEALEEGEGEEGDDGFDLDATLRRGQAHPASSFSPPPAAPGLLLHSASAPPPPLFPGVGEVGATARFLPPALATMTPLSSKQLAAGAPVRAPGTAGGGAAGAGAGAGAGAHHHGGGSKRRLGTKHVFWTSVETMWGVLIFLRFGWCVGQVGLVPTLGAVLLSAACQSLCASSLSAVATNGIVTRSGGAYLMVVKALGLGPGASVGFFYWLGMTALMAVELYGFAEGAELLVRYRYHHAGGEQNPEPHIGEAPFTSHSSYYWDRVLLCFIGLAFLLLVRLLMRRQERHRIVGVVVFIFFLSLASCCGGVLAALGGQWRPHGVQAAGYPWPSGKTLWGNMLLPNDKVTFNDFRNVLSVVYPSFIGIFQGANLCSDLQHPFRSIPRGTFFSILASCGLYALVFLIAAMAAPSSILREDTEVLLRYAWPSPLLGYAGTMAVGLISALSCFEVSPRILQSLAEDRAIRVLSDWELNKLYSWGYRGQVPVRSILLTGALAVPFLFLPSIELIARATAVCFLTMYSSMNLACLLQSALQLHTWRPAFAYYSWVSALLGTLTCLFLSFYLDGLISLFILALAFFLFVYIEIKGDVSSFGHGIRGLKYHVTLMSLYGLEESITANAVMGDKSPFWRRRRQAAGPGPGRGGLSSPRGAPSAAVSAPPASTTPATATAAGGGYWRPQILVYLPASDIIGLPLGTGGDASRKRQLLSFVGQLKATRGLTIGGTVMLEERNLLEDIRRSRTALALHAGSPQAAAQSLASLLAAEQEKANAVKKQIMGELAREGILGFVEVASAPDLRTGLSMLLQLTGLGSLRPNTLVLAWPDARRITHERALRFLEFIARAAVNEKAVVALKTWGPHFQPFPTSNQVMRGSLDVWWLLHDGGVLLLLAYLLQRHGTWRRCTLRIFTVVQGSERDVLKTQLELTHYLQALRIKAEVHVVGLDLQDMGEYGEDWTIRRKHAQPATEQRSSLSGAFAGGGQAQSADPPPSSSASGRLGGTSHIDEGSKIQKAIVMHSRESALVLINLPPPPKSAWVDPMPYFRLVEALTGELQRVILVYGSGAEVLTTSL